MSTSPVLQLLKPSYLPIVRAETQTGVVVVVVVWLLDNPPVIGCVTQKFISRQELVLREMTSAALRSAAAAAAFNPQDWLADAASCGLVPEEFGASGGMPLETETDHDAWVSGHAQPDHYSSSSSSEDDGGVDEGGCDNSLLASKKRRLDPPERRSSGGRRRRAPLSPTWVAIANCLFEHAMIRELKVRLMERSCTC